MSFKRFLRRCFDDWTVLKYGWLAVFIIHIAYLAVGVFWLKRAMRMESIELLTVPQVRISYVLTSAHMVIIAFSTILLIITVFVFEIFKMMRRLAVDMRDLNERMDLLREETEALGRLGLTGLDDSYSPAMEADRYDGDPDRAEAGRDGGGAGR